MNCDQVMNKAAFTLTPDVTVENALSQMKKMGMYAAAVVDSAGIGVGYFSLRNLMSNILPVSMMSDSVMPDLMIANAPGLELRLQKVLLEPIEAVMERKFLSVYPDTTESEAARLITAHGEDVMVVDEVSGQLLGIISDNSMIEGLLKNFAVTHSAVAV